MEKKTFKQKLKAFMESFIWLFFIMLAIDIITKQVVHANQDKILSSGIYGIDLIKGFLAISYVENPGAAFGLGNSNPGVARIIYILLALGGSAIGLYYYIKKYKTLNKMYKACIMLLVCGAIGNLIDRAFYKFSDYAVVDWIAFYGIWDPVFNIADSCIVVGAILLIAYILIKDILDNVKKKKESQHVEKKPIQQNVDDKHKK